MIAMIKPLQRFFPCSGSFIFKKELYSFCTHSEHTSKKNIIVEEEP